MPVDVPASLLQQVLLLGILPLWMAVGLADAFCHRAQRIEYSSGWKEALLHVLMIAELGIGLLAVLLLEITSAVLCLLVAVAVLHELTNWQDLRYASTRRTIPPLEQWVHAWQFTLPWVALAVLLLIHRDTWQAWFAPAGSADWSWRLKDRPLPPQIIAVVLVAAALFVLLPFAAECLRCARAARATDDT